MSKIKKTKKFVSQPLNFSHIGHLGPQDVVSTTSGGDEAAIQPPAPCQGTEIKDLQKFFTSDEFLQMLRTIVREETVRALHDVGIASEKTEYFGDPPSPCNGLRSVSCETELEPRSPTISDLTEDKNISLRFDNPLYEVQNRPKPVPRLRKLKGVQSSDGESQTELKATTRHKTGAALRLSREDERECLSQALQANIVHLVDRLQFNNSVLPDQLISSGHMTEEECRMLRNDIKSRKDQVRYLISRTKCRDLEDIHKFLELVNSEVPDVVKRIRQQFEENKKNNIKCTTCALCQCTNNVDIKGFVDVLWSIRAVSDGFYNEVIACSKPRGSQEVLWKSLVDICNGKQSREKQKNYAILFEFMRKKGNFDFIIKPLQGMLEKDGRIECHCHTSLKTSSSDRGSYGVQSSCSPRSSYSTHESRESIFSGDFSQDVEQAEERLGRIDESRDRKLERQNAFDDYRSKLVTHKKRLSHTASLDMLETIQEESSKQNKKVCRKGIDYVSHTVEFHGPYLSNHTELMGRVSKRMDIQFQELRGFEQNRSSEA